MSKPQLNEKLAPAKAQRRKEEGAKLVKDSSLRLCAFAGEILLVT
jgi:hypothetical protein